MSDTSIDGCSALNGGAIYNLGILELKNSALMNNVAENNGGAIYNAGSVTTNNVVITGNSARQGAGGAIYADFRSGPINYMEYFGAVCILNTSISGNRSAQDGGGIAVDSQIIAMRRPLVLFVNSAVAGNSAMSGADYEYSDLFIEPGVFSYYSSNMLKVYYSAFGAVSDDYGIEDISYGSVVLGGVISGDVIFEGSESPDGLFSPDITTSGKLSAITLSGGATYDSAYVYHLPFNISAFMALSYGVSVLDSNTGFEYLVGTVPENDYSNMITTDIFGNSRAGAANKIGAFVG
jgi:predicted outer membrane repeat protein